MNDCREHSGTNKPEAISTVALETVDGTWIEIEREADIFIYDRMKTTSVVVFEPEGTQFISSQSKSPQLRQGEEKALLQNEAGTSGHDTRAERRGP